MRVERGQHTVDRAANQDIVLDRLDIASLDPLVGGEQAREFGSGAPVHLRQPGGGGGDQGDGGNQCCTAGKFGEFHGRCPIMSCAVLSPALAER